MKNLLLFVFIFSLIGCGNNKRIKLIESFVCTEDGITSDLDFKIIKFKKSSTFTTTDSLLFLIEDTVVTKYKWQGDTLFYIPPKSYYPPNEPWFSPDYVTKSLIDSELDTAIKHRDRALTTYNEFLALERKIKELDADIEATLGYEFKPESKRNYMDHQRENIEAWNKDISNLKREQKYIMMPHDSILSILYDCTYSIINPLLKVKQTQTQTFYFDDNFKKVIGSSGIKK